MFLALLNSEIDELSERIESALRLVRGTRPVAPELASAARTDAAALRKDLHRCARSCRATDTPVSYRQCARGSACRTFFPQLIGFRRSADRVRCAVSRYPESPSSAWAGEAQGR